MTELGTGTHHPRAATLRGRAAGRTDEVTSRIATTVVKPVEVNTRAKLRATVRAKDVVPSGKVEVRVKAG
jgi:hypothetical protein